MLQACVVLVAPRQQCNSLFLMCYNSQSAHGQSHSDLPYITVCDTPSDCAAQRYTRQWHTVAYGMQVKGTRPSTQHW